MKKLVVGALLLLSVVVMPCQAFETVPGLENVQEQAESYGLTMETELERGLYDLLLSGVGQAKELLVRELHTAWKLMAVVLFCAMAQGGANGMEGLKAVELAGAAAITALTMTDVASVIGMGRDTIGRIDLFSEAILPVMAVLAAATGGITSAALRQGATVFFSKLLLLAMNELLIPMVYAYVAVNCVHAAIGNPGLQKLAALIKSLVAGILTALLLAFVGYLTASGAISGSADAAAVKAARMTISRLIPVVGGILSDASESVLAGAGILKSSVGVVGLLVVLAICLTPFLRLSLQYLIYKVTAALCATVAQPRLSQLIDSIGTAFGLVLGMSGASALILLFSIVSAVSAVVS